MAERHLAALGEPPAEQRGDRRDAPTADVN
jgi:hypothetical protein